jgi:hypothetical protein
MLFTILVLAKCFPQFGSCASSTQKVLALGLDEKKLELKLLGFNAQIGELANMIKKLALCIIYMILDMPIV